MSRLYYPVDIDYIPAVNRLTKHEQLVLCLVASLLLVGWAVKAYRAAHPPPTVELGSGGPPKP